MTAEAISESELFVQCYARPALVLEPVDSKIRTLQQLEQGETIAGLDLRYWPREVQYSEEADTEPLRAYQQFTDWATACDVEVHPPFRRRQSQTLADATRSEMLVTPVMALSVYDGGVLAGVFPHRDGETQRSVTDAIAALRTGDIAELLASLPTPAEPIQHESPPAHGLESLNCPDCGGSLVNVQGILTCTDCQRGIDIGRTTTETRQPPVADQ